MRPYRSELFALFQRAGRRLSKAARDAVEATLGNGDDGSIVVTGLDHFVLTVADIDRTVAFYQRVLGMRPITFGDGRRALKFGLSKINLHQVGRELRPHAAKPTPGSADVCLVTSMKPYIVVKRLEALDVRVEEGPVDRTGARGRISSVYFRDPDGNLIELGFYGTVADAHSQAAAPSGLA